MTGGALGACLPDRRSAPYKPRTFNRRVSNGTMAIERTFSIIKPDATKRNLTGKIVDKLESAGLRVVAQKRIRMTRAQAEGFYAVHKERPFFGELVEFMISGPVVVQVLEGENAVAKNREVMGATNPKDAAPGTHPQGLRPLRRRELGARLRRAGDGEGGDRLLLQGQRDRRLSPSRFREATGRPERALVARYGITASRTPEGNGVLPPASG